MVKRADSHLSTPVLVVSLILGRRGETVLILKEDIFLRLVPFALCKGIILLRCHIKSSVLFRQLLQYFLGGQITQDKADWMLLVALKKRLQNFGTALKSNYLLCERAVLSNNFTTCE